MLTFDHQNIQESIRLIKESNCIAILTHVRPDGDALGSSTGFYRFLESIGKDARILIANKYSDNLAFIISEDIKDKILIYEDDKEEIEAFLEKCDLIVGVDFNTFARLDDMSAIARACKAKKILIDHHLAPGYDEFDIIFSKTDISSASELEYWYLKEIISENAFGADYKLPDTLLYSLMIGMTTDTNNFANSVYPSTLNMASELLAAGVDRDKILYELYNRQSENRLRLMGHLMKDVMEITEDGIAIITFSKEDRQEYQTKDGETEGFVNMPLSIEKVKMSIFAREDGENVRISLRSKKGISANKCSREWFNGGGHEQAAGGRLTIGKEVATFAAVADYIKEKTHKFMTQE